MSILNATTATPQPAAAPIGDTMPTDESPMRGRSRTRSHTPTSMARAQSPSRSHTSEKSRSRSARRSISPRSRSISRSPTPLPPSRRNGNRTRTPSRSRSPSRGANRSYRDRSYSRSPSRPLSHRGVQSSKIVVEKLTKNVTEAHLREIFSTYGRIESLDMPMNRQCKPNTSHELANC